MAFLAVEALASAADPVDAFPRATQRPRGPASSPGRGRPLRVVVALPAPPRRRPLRPRAQRRAFLEVCEARLDLGLDVDEPAPHPAERLALPPSCQAAYFEGAPCPCTCTFRLCLGVVNRERDQLGGDRLPAEVRPPAPSSGAYRASWEVSGPLPPAVVPFHRRPDVLSDPRRCRACGSGTVEAHQCRRCGVFTSVEGPIDVDEGVDLAGEEGDNPPLAYLSDRSREVLGWLVQDLGAQLLEIRSRTAPVDVPDEPPGDDRDDHDLQLATKTPPDPPRVVGLPPFDWASAVPLPPVPAPALSVYRFPHPLDGPPAPRSPAPDHVPLALCTEPPRYAPPNRGMRGWDAGVSRKQSGLVGTGAGRGKGGKGAGGPWDLPERERHALREGARAAVRNILSEVSGEVRQGATDPPISAPTIPGVRESVRNAIGGASERGGELPPAARSRRPGRPDHARPCPLTPPPGVRGGLSRGVYPPVSTRC